MNTTHDDHAATTPEFIIRIDYHGSMTRQPEYVREGIGILTFHTLSDAAQAAQLLNGCAASEGTFRAIDANGPHVIDHITANERLERWRQTP